MRLRDVVDGLSRCGVTEGLVIDLAGCSSMDSSGLSALIFAQRRASTPLLVVAGGELRRLLLVTSLADVFAVVGSREEALEAFRIEARLPSTPDAKPSLGSPAA